MNNQRKKRFVPASSSPNDEEVGTNISALYSQIISSPPTSSSSSKSKSNSKANTTLTITTKDDSDDDVKIIEQQCPVCNIPITNMIEHTKTSLHMFNLSSSTPRPTFIAIPQNNKGYQMLKNKMGWKEDEGLGAQSQGIKIPVRAVQKRDRKGVGNKSTTPVVDKKKRKITYEPAGSDSISRQERDKQVKAEKDKLSTIREAVFNDFEYLV